MVAVNPLVPSLKPSRAPQLNKKRMLQELYYISALGLKKVLHFEIRFVLFVKSMKYNGKNAKTYLKLRQQ